MAVDTNAIAITTTAVKLTTATPNADGVAGESVIVYNDGAVTAYVGGSGVTAVGAKKGGPVPASSWSPGIDLQQGDALYAITASGSTTLIVLESGV